jgi:hypothetical protein
MVNAALKSTTDLGDEVVEVAFRTPGRDHEGAASAKIAADDR